MLPILLLLLLSLPVAAQNLPDRHIVLDPLDLPEESGETVWLPGTRLYAEFSRYDNGSGDDHRWNAKTGGYAGIVRTEDWSVVAVGTMEVVVDPQNDIAFNPRAIFWEEGLMVAHDLSDAASLQFGYMHRCKHDIDNLEIDLIRGDREQRTLIYSGPFVRLLARPRPLAEGSPLSVGGALRADYYVHTLDDRGLSGTTGIGLDATGLVASLGASGSLRYATSAGSRLYLDLRAMATAQDLSPRASDGGRLAILGSLPGVEIGLELFNPDGGAFALFARLERQRDSGIRATPTAATLATIGIRMASERGMW